MAVLNEGLDFETTIAMAASSKPRPFEIVVVDDCSLEPVKSRLDPWASRNDLLIKYIRTNRRMGSGYCKHFALEQAEGDLRIVVDSHMRFPWEWLEKLVEEHRTHPQAILCPVSRGFGYQGRQFTGYGCDFRLSDELGFWEGKWRVAPDALSNNIPCLMGGAYAIPADVLQYVGGYAPGFRGFGCEEEYLSLRAWLCGFSVRLVPEVETEHQYDRQVDRRTADGGSGELTWETTFNRHVTAMIVFEDDVYERCYRPRLLAVNPDTEVLRRLAKYEVFLRDLRQALQSRRRVSDAELEALCGIKHPSGDELSLLVHPDGLKEMGPIATTF
jgi:glycosyltransferase involved in cell wall biosynthesis